MSANGSDHALADVTNRVANTQLNEDARKRVGERGWAEPQKFDYDAYAAGPNNKGSAPAPAADEDQGRDMQGWAANAVKYEWSDEYGDIGPKHEELEKMLFRDEHQMERGSEFSR